jgi:hypothetical protein
MFRYGTDYELQANLGFEGFTAVVMKNPVLWGYAVSVYYKLTFRKNVSPPSLRQKNNESEEKCKTVARVLHQQSDYVGKEVVRLALDPEVRGSVPTRQRSQLVCHVPLRAA